MDVRSNDSGQGTGDGRSGAAETRSTPSRGLSYWYATAKDGGGLSPDVFAEMMSQTHFGDACRTSHRSFLARTQGNPVLTRVTRDTTRQVYGFLVLYLDALGAITLKAIQDLCREINLASPGRAQAILFHLRAIGYLRRDPDSTDRRSRHYLPSPEMKDALRCEIFDDLCALSLIEPEAKRAADRLSEPEFFRAFLLRYGKGIVEALKFRPGRVISHFTNRDAGLVLLCDVILSSDDEAYPPRGPLRMSVRELARKYDVSRTHVLRLFRGAEQLGLLTRNAEEQTVTLSEGFARDIAEFHVVYFVGMATCAQHAFQSNAAATGG